MNEPQQNLNSSTDQQYSPITPVGPSVSPVMNEPFKQPKKKGKTLRIILIIIGLVIIFAVALVVYLAKSPKTLDKLAQPALVNNSQNTQRENDASKLAAALATFLDVHKGVYPVSTASGVSPGTLNICGTDCTVANKETVSLGYYANTPTAVSFHTFASGLTVPDTKTVYIVPSANCKTDKSGIGDSTIGQKYVSIVVLYAIQSGTATKQQCLNPYQ